MIKFAHNNFNVLDLEKSLQFYQEALNLKEVRRTEKPPHTLELTWLKDRKEPYNLGENEFHLAFVTDDYEALHEKHKKMGCICYENPMMGIYFINDPDGYWLEILPVR